MPFGATNAPATFQRLMHDCSGDLNMNWCIVYLDDIIIFSDTKEEHLKRLEAVFQKLATAGLKLKPSKCFITSGLSVCLVHCEYRWHSKLDLVYHMVYHRFSQVR